METTLHINLAPYKSAKATIFVGQKQGEHARMILHLDQVDLWIKDDKEFQVQFEFPEETCSVNTSFLLGLLGDTYRTIGSDAFVARVKFESKEYDITGDLSEFIRQMKIYK